MEIGSQYKGERKKERERTEIGNRSILSIYAWTLKFHVSESCITERVCECVSVWTPGTCMYLHSLPTIQQSSSQPCQKEFPSRVTRNANEDPSEAILNSPGIQVSSSVAGRVVLRIPSSDTLQDVLMRITPRRLQ